MSAHWLSRVVILCCLLVVPAVSRADDDLARLVERSRLAVQKLTADVNQALAQSRALERTEPEQARALLEKMGQEVRDAQDYLAPELRTRMLRQLESRQRELAEAARHRRLADEEAARQAAARTRPPQALPREGPAALVQQTITNQNANLAAVDRRKVDAARGFEGAMQNIREAATPIAGNIAFDKDHATRVEIRRQTVGQQLTPKEVALLKGLNSVLSVDFNNSQFKLVLEFLQEKTGISIIVDQTALRDAMVEYEDPVTFKANKITVRTILRKILNDKGLAYVLKEGTVQVVTAQRARDMLTMRTYPIDDLVVSGFGAAQYGPFWGQVVARQQALSNAQGIINMIQTSIEPAMWNTNGGPCSISFFEPGMALVVRAPAEMHYMLGSSLYGR